MKIQLHDVNNSVIDSDDIKKCWSPYVVIRIGEHNSLIKTVINISPEYGLSRSESTKRYYYYYKENEHMINGDISLIRRYHNNDFFNNFHDCDIITISKMITSNDLYITYFKFNNYEFIPCISIRRNNEFITKLNSCTNFNKFQTDLGSIFVNKVYNFENIEIILDKAGDLSFRDVVGKGVIGFTHLTRTNIFTEKDIPDLRKFLEDNKFKIKEE